MVTGIVLECSDDFNDVPCPHCGHVETLSSDIQDVWTCDACKRDFWILPLLLIGSKKPRVGYDENGIPMAWQLSIGNLTYYPDDYAED